MKKRVVVSAVSLLIGGGLLGCWYTGQQFDRFVLQQVDILKQENNIELQWQVNKSHLFTRDGVLTLVVKPDALAALDPALESPQPLRLVFDVSGQIWPLYIKNHVQLNTQSGSLADSFAHLGMAKWRLAIESVSSLWSKSHRSQFAADALNIKQPDYELTFQPLKGEFNGDLVGQGELNLQWQGMRLLDTHSEMDLALAQLGINAQFHNTGTVMLSPHSTLQLGSFSFNLPQRGKVQLKGLTTQAQLNAGSSETLTNDYQIKMDSLQLEDDSDALAMTDGILKLSVVGLDLEGYQGLQVAGGKKSEDDAIQHALDKLLKRGLTLVLEDLSSKLNGEPISLRGKLSLDPTNLETLFNSEEGIFALHGQLNATLSERLGKAVPQLAALLKQLTAVGYLSAKDQQLSAKVTFEQGVLNINNLPLQ